MAALRRLSNYIKSKLNKWLDKKEDPVEVLNYANSQYREKYKEVKKSLIIIKTNRKRLEAQENLLKDNIRETVLKAKAAIQLNKEVLAEKYLKLKLSYQEQLRSLETRIITVKAQEDKLVDASIKLKNQLEEYDSKRQVLEANYKASKAQAEIGEVLVGIDSNSLKESMELAEDKINDMQSRSSAINEVIEQAEEANPDKELDSLIEKQALQEEMKLLKEEVNDKNSLKPKTKEIEKNSLN